MRIIPTHFSISVKAAETRVCVGVSKPFHTIITHNYLPRLNPQPNLNIQMPPTHLANKNAGVCVLRKMIDLTHKTEYTLY